MKFLWAHQTDRRATQTQSYMYFFIFCINITKYNHYCFFFAIGLCSDTQNTSLYHRTWSSKTRVSINLEKYQLEKQKAYHVFVWARSLISLGWFISLIINWFILKLIQNKKKSLSKNNFTTTIPFHYSGISSVQWGAWIPNIQIQNPSEIRTFIKIDIGMVQLGNGQDYSYSYVLEPTIQKTEPVHNNKNGIQTSPNHSETEPFTNWTALDHLKSKHVQHLSPHCMQLAQAYHNG